MGKYGKKLITKGLGKTDRCPECGRWKTYNDGGGFICTNVKSCRLSISKENDLAEVDKLRGNEWQILSKPHK